MSRINVTFLLHQRTCYFPGNGKVTKGFPEGDSEFPPPEPPLETAKGGHPLLIPPSAVQRVRTILIPKCKPAERLHFGEEEERWSGRELPERAF